LHFVAAKCLIQNKPESLFIQVLNPTDDIIKVHSGYVIASIDKIDHNNIIDMSNKNLKDPRGNLELARTPIVAEPFLTIDKPLKNGQFYCTDGKQHF
jgi:hypothetical protein